MLHELLHIAVKAGGGVATPGSTDSFVNNPEDNFINPTQRPLLDILRDNPKLTAWLTEVL